MPITLTSVSAYTPADLDNEPEWGLDPFIGELASGASPQEANAAVCNQRSSEVFNTSEMGLLLQGKTPESK